MYACLCVAEKRREGGEDHREGVDLTKDGRPQATDKEWGQRWQTTGGGHTCIPQLYPSGFVASPLFIFCTCTFNMSKYEQKVERGRKDP